MKFLSTTVLLAAFFIGCANAQSDRPTAAVMDTQISEEARAARIPPGIAETLRLEIENALRGSRRFTMLERDTVNLDMAFAEQELADSELSNSQNVRSGSLEAAGYVVVPRITQHRIGARFEAVDALPGMFNRQDSARLSATVRVLSSTTGALLYSSDDDATYFRTLEMVNGRTGGPSAATMERLAEQLGRSLGADIIEFRFPVMVAQVQNNEVYLNRGEGGLEIGDELIVFNQGPQLIDPATGEPLGGFGASVETQVATVRVVRVAPRFSVAQVIEGDGAAVDVGAVARRPQ